MMIPALAFNDVFPMLDEEFDGAANGLPVDANWPHAVSDDLAWDDQLDSGHEMAINDYNF